ncbi:MAG TPA: LPS export ABC transporter periplasmic protein LptC [Steroidobacteraceae bacterium]
MIRTRLLLLALLAALSTLIWIERRPELDETATSSTPNESPQPGISARNAVLIETSDAGQPLYVLHASQIDQPQEGANIELTAPDLSYLPAGEPHWNVQAERGVLPPDARHADLSGAVHAHGDSGNEAPLLIQSEQLAFDLPGQSIDTKQPVTIDWGRNHATAVGMHVDLNARSVVLESEFRGESRN